LQPLLRRGEPERADLAPAGLEPDLGAERAVELDRVHHHLRQAQRAAQLADEAGGVEGRAARQVGALDEDDVAAPELRQPVGDRAAADAAADHDHLCAGLQVARAIQSGSAQRRASSTTVAALIARSCTVTHSRTEWYSMPPS